MTGLSEQELQEAAAEAGISPAELRQALAEQHGNLPAKLPQDQGIVPRSRRGPSIAHAEASIPWAPHLAVRSVRAALERQLNLRGHMQSATEADVVDTNAGLAYHIRAMPDGGHGSMVRIDIDPSPRQGKKALAAVALTTSVLILGIGGLFSWTWLGAAVAVGIVGGLLMRRLNTRGAGDARGNAAKALLDAEQAGPPPEAFQQAALPSGHQGHTPGYVPPGYPPQGRR
jgi:hypothetical protein